MGGQHNFVYLKHYQSQAEQGAILLIVAIIAGVLLLFAGLAIDGSILATSKVQQRHSAEFVALGALKTSAQTTGSAWDKLNAAVARARDIAGNNVFLAEPFLKIPFQSKELGSTQVPVAGAYSESHGRIIPGIWHFKPGAAACNAVVNLGDPVNPAPCPCDSADPTQWATPCFRPLDFTDAVESTLNVNAYKVELKTSTASPIRTLFTRIGGQEFVSIGSTATAAYIPQHGVFLTDLSRSAHFKTHVPYEITTSVTPTPAGRYAYTDASESAFRLDQVDGAAASCQADHSNFCFYNFVSPNLIPRCDITGGHAGDLYETVYYYRNGTTYITQNPGSPLYQPANPFRPITQITAPTRHYKRDYQCFSVNYLERDIDGTVSPAITEHYLVDTYRGVTDSGAVYDGPEPLTSMRAGIYHALELFEARAVPGDRVGLVGFDRSATISARVFSTNASGDPQMVAIGSTEFDEMKEATDIGRCLMTDGSCVPAVTNTPKDRAQISNHFFFPRVIASDTAGSTNVPEALRVAYNMLLDAPGAADATNFVVLLSDGLTTCTSDRVCAGDYAAFQSSLNEAKSIIDTQYVSDSIRFDMIMMGERVGVHSLLVPYPVGNPSRCATDNELRLEYPVADFVDWTSYNTGSAADAFDQMNKGLGTFYGSQQFYQLVRATDGYWFPIRPSCSPGIDVTLDLDTECATGVTPVSKAPFTDSPGRLNCDAKGRTERIQIRDAMDQLFKSPFVLVDEGPAEGY